MLPLEISIEPSFFSFRMLVLISVVFYYFDVTAYPSVLDVTQGSSDDVFKHHQKIGSIVN